MGSEVKHGVNKYGVQGVKEDATYHCVYYYGDGVEIRRSYEGVPQSLIDNLTPESINE